MLKPLEKSLIVSEFAKQVEFAKDLGLQVHVGHGINYATAPYFQMVEGVEEANIGHAIVARSIFCGLEKAISQMKSLLNKVEYKPEII